MGMGFAMANQIAQAMNNPAGQQQQPASPAGPMTPPPLPTASAFFAAINNQQAGPFDLDQLQQMIGSGQITRATLVWRPGMSQWIAAGEVGELNNLFVQMPPPLPGMG
jgi:hypothetical protein